MFLLRPPSQAQVAHFLEEQRRAPFSYAEVGQTRDSHQPSGYALDAHTVGLGEGEQVFGRAREALWRWQVFETGWVRLETPDVPLAPGETLVLSVAHLGFHSLIANRIVYVLDEPNRFGFGYGTLTGHAEQGEERFLVTLDAREQVRFELYAFSTPRHPLARLGTPIVRRLQHAAARSYGDAMRRVVQS